MDRRCASDDVDFAPDRADGVVVSGRRHRRPWRPPVGVGVIREDGDHKGPTDRSPPQAMATHRQILPQLPPWPGPPSQRFVPLISIQGGLKTRITSLDYCSAASSAICANPSAIACLPTACAIARLTPRDFDNAGRRLAALFFFGGRVVRRSGFTGCTPLRAELEGLLKPRPYCGAATTCTGVPSAKSPVGLVMSDSAPLRPEMISTSVP
jgi:hypothetical protein